MRFTVKQPKTVEEFKRYYHLRWKLLREPWNQPEGTEVDDIEDQCSHFMVIDEDFDEQKNIIAVARLQFNAVSEAQIRYMAVEKSHERQGIGRQLIDMIESQTRSSSCNKIILDAREPAVGFYQKLGYTIIEKSYLLFDEIQHFRMSKNI